MVTSKLAAKLRQSIPALPPVVPVAEGTGKGAPAPAPSAVIGSPAPAGVGAGGRPATNQSTTGAKRPAVLKGMESLNVWLRKEAAEILAGQHSDKTLAQYERNGARLPVTALVDQFYADIQAAGGNRLDTSSLIKRLR